jgi:hypothetical protein
MKTFRIEYDIWGQEVPRRLIEAKYFQIEDGWITFKDDDNKAVLLIKERAVASIETLGGA